MKPSDIIPGRSYVDRHGNIFHVREINSRQVYFHVDGILHLPIASSGIEAFSAEMVMALKGKGQRDE